MKTANIIFIIFFILLSIFLFLTNTLFYNIIDVIIVLLLLATVSWLENFFHKKRVSQWEHIRTKGKWYFIFLHFVLLRGIIISTVLTFLLFSKTSIVLLLLCVIVPLLALMVFAGNE